MQGYIFRINSVVNRRDSKEVGRKCLCHHGGLESVIAMGDETGHCC